MDDSSPGHTLLKKNKVNIFTSLRNVNNSHWIDNGNIETLSVSADEGSTPPAKKPKKNGKKSANVDADVDNNMSKREVWKYYWVVGLCHERGSRNDEFNKPVK